MHHFSMHALKLISALPLLHKVFFKNSTAKAKSVKVLGLHFRNALGLAAGFDKNAKYLAELEKLGFGFVEIGTVTPLPQAGNPKPRLFRLPKDKVIINRMGFNNEGTKAVAERLQKFRARTRTLAPGGNGQFIIGGNIGKNKVTPNEEAWKDYEICFLALHEWVDYFVVNVSSPNTPGLRDLQQKEALGKILTHLQDLNRHKNIQKPILLKISPDLAKEELDDIIDLALEIKLDGLVAANTTLSRKDLVSTHKEIEQTGAGGLSGLPLAEVSANICTYIHHKTKGDLPLISSGGIFTPEEARERIKNGASLIQVWTGFIYEGPAIVNKIVQSL